MTVKRKLGLSKVNKKPKIESSVEATELTVELPEVVDENDGIGQIQGLWDKYKQEPNELIINGIIHECDRMLRANESVNDLFYCYYGMALNELSKFQTGETQEPIIDEALERVEDGLEKFPNSINLFFTKAKIGLTKVINDVGNIKRSKRIQEPLRKTLVEARKYLDCYERGVVQSDEQKNYEFYNDQTYEVLELFDHYLEIIEEHIEIEDELNRWWRDQNLKFVEYSKDNDKLYRKVNKNLGVSYLQEAEEPLNIYTMLMYDEDFEGDNINGITQDEAQKKAIELYEVAIKYLKQNWDDEDPETWVGVAEAMIGLGNLYAGKQQEDCYKEAEEILVRANNVSNGKYKEVLENLLGNDDDDDDDDE